MKDTRTLHEKMVDAFEEEYNAGRALFGCYASAAIRVYRQHLRNQRVKRSQGIIVRPK